MGKRETTMLPVDNYRHRIGTHESKKVGTFIDLELIDAIIWHTSRRIHLDEIIPSK